MKTLLRLTLISWLWLSVSAVLWGTFDQIPHYHGVQGRVRLLNTKTIRLEDFYWDGGGIVVYAYSFPPGVNPSTGSGDIIPVPGGGSDGRFALGREYTGEIFDIPLPDGMDACDIGTFTIWCQPASIFFNSVTLNQTVFVNNGEDLCTLPPESIEVPLSTPPPPEFDNCKVLDPGLHLRWRVNRNESNVRFQLCGCLSSSPDVDQYMGFGVSGSDVSTSMFRADPTITWVDTSSQPNAIDYHLSAYTQCVNGEGACPDLMDPRNCTNDATLIGGFRDDSQQCVTFTRPFTSADVGTCDQSLDPDNENQYVVWGVGGLGVTAFRHFLRAQRSDGPLHLGRDPLDECGNTLPTCTTCPPFEAERIVALENTTFRAVIGPSGNERGYMSITGQPGWGIAWYINGMLVPELVVQRGSTYTFIVEGGDNANSLMVYHPFYLTDSITGGKLRGMFPGEVVYAGFNNDQPTAVGRLCELNEGPMALASRTSCQGIADYLSKLEESSGCSQGQPGTLTWTPDESTPDTLYYQCATHYNLGWRITVQDAPTAISTTRGTTVQDTPTAISTTKGTTVQDTPTVASTMISATTTVGTNINITGDGGSKALLASTVSVIVFILCSLLFQF